MGCPIELEPQDIEEIVTAGILRTLVRYELKPLLAIMLSSPRHQAQNLRPFHLVPVIVLATAESDLNFLPASS